ncbi:MAG: EscU/YscU/HrcU family type III secretion system export apparatus switch protein [Clostridiales bacterium]|jgi:flagellar biosynthesis protein|nr:EscU/YscU/HrcU family type III secretion system export apparatus switch protein [Clostridiales bacterium]
MDENKKPLNPRMRAVAVKYDPTDVAPKVVAKGVGVIADKIIDKARDTNVPVYQDAQLAEDLTKLELGEHIPPELYEVVAQVLIFISDLDRLEAYRKVVKPSGSGPDRAK